MSTSQEESVTLIQILAEDLMQDQFSSPNKNANGMENIDDLCDDEAMVHTNNQRKKKKKKSKRHVISPLQIFAFSQEKQQKLNQEKAALPCTKDMVKKPLLKCATFPSSSTVQRLKVEDMKVKSSNLQAIHDDGLLHEPQNSFHASMQCSLLTSSCILRSALRGSHEDKGLGPRPKLQVKWAKEVFEPSTTSISHTVDLCQQGSRKIEHIRGQNLKSSKAQKSTERTNTKLSARCREKLRHEQEALTSTEGKQQDGIISRDGVSTFPAFSQAPSSCLTNLAPNQVFTKHPFVCAGACDQEQISGSSPDGLDEFLMLSEVDGFDTLSLKCSSQYGHNSHKDLVMPTKICNIQHVSHCKKSMSDTECSFDLTNASVQCNNTQSVIIHQSVGCHLLASSLVTEV